MLDFALGPGLSTLSKEERRVIREVERAQKFARLEEEDDEVYEDDTCPKKCSARQVDKALKTMQLLAAKKAEMMARAPSGATAASSASEKGKDTGATEATSASENGKETGAIGPTEAIEASEKGKEIGATIASEGSLSND